MPSSLRALGVLLLAGASVVESLAPVAPPPPAASVQDGEGEEEAGIRAGTYAIDAGHSSVMFRIKHFGVSWFYGRFNDVSGTVVHDPGDPTASRVEFAVETASVDSKDGQRDDHLRSADFFDVENHPRMTFESTEVEALPGGRLAVTGELQLRGVTQTRTIEVDVVGGGPDPFGGYRSGYHTTFTLRRSEFGITAYLGGALGDDVEVTISLETILR